MVPNRRSNRSAAVAAVVEAVEAAEGAVAAGAAEVAAAEAAEAVAAAVHSGGAEPACPADNPGTGTAEVGQTHQSLIRGCGRAMIAMTVEVRPRTPTNPKAFRSARSPRCRRGSAIRAELYRVFSAIRCRVPLFGAQEVFSLRPALLRAGLRDSRGDHSKSARK